MKDLSDKEFRMLAPEAKPGADNKMIVFMHPKSTNNCAGGAL